MPNSDARFELECFHNEYLPDGGRDVDAIITVSARGAGHVPVAGAAGGRGDHRRCLRFDDGKEDP